jgi:glycerol-3-phosphate dehydrogenase
MTYDFVIIGSGIIGTTIARALSRYDLNIIVLEKENDVANHQTIANSAIIHSGHDPIPNTLKAQLCVLGNRMYETMEKELDIPLLYTGAFVVAKGQEQEAHLKELYDRALVNGVQGVEILSGQEALKLERNLAPDVTQVLSLPTTKVTFPWEVAFACMENAIKNGASLRKNAEVTALVKIDDIYHVTLNHQEVILTKGIINASGVFSDHVASMLEHDVPYKITPRKGEYFVLDKRVEGFIERVLYPIPTNLGKGVLLVPQVHGNILVGPTSKNIDAYDDLSNTTEALTQITKQAKQLSLNIPFDQIIRTFSGIRATSTYEDFYIKESLTYGNFYHVAGIDSPGLTAAPAIAEYVVDLIKEKNTLIEKENYTPIRQKMHLFHHLDIKEKQALLKKDPLYGNIICKCERITEREIIDAIKGPLGSNTIKGIKKRARAGSGLCQGGYCEGNVLRIIARETNTPITKINYYDLNTPILLEETKVKK